MYRFFEQRLAESIRDFLRRQYQVEKDRIVIERPPDVALGDYATPVAFELAKTLRKAPRKIAQEIVDGIGEVQGFAKFEVAGAGYINARLVRSSFALAATKPPQPAKAASGKAMVEHSSINPNKAAHIGHLRNAILGDTFVRLLRFAGREVDVQNYIDNTGAQVADVVVGFQHLDPKNKSEIESLAAQPRFDYYCWDLYARVSQWYAEDKDRLKIRQNALSEIERGNNETAAMAEAISTAIIRRHLETMLRLGIEYDFLPRESEILHLHFWDAAFSKLKAAGVLRYEETGKNKGCWVMQRNSDASQEEDDEDNQKVIVRSNGTVGYVGKDIAYHMWKFGLLGLDFGYQKFYRYPDAHEVWISSVDADPQHPHFGSVADIYNVIDARQSEAQTAVIEALRGLGHADAAEHYTHFSYEMVALTPRCAAELGYSLSDEDSKRSYIEVSGRKGFGVKADDLIDRLIASAKKEVDARHPEIAEGERETIARQIAIGALRYFMLRYTKSSVIAFDFKDALSFEGETGPYVQYAAVRAGNIFRKANLDPDQLAALSETEANSQFNSGPQACGDDIWELWLTAGQTSYAVEQCIASNEPAHLAKHAFQLAQRFNGFYHKHPILQEPDESRKRLLLATAAVVRRELTRALGIMGISVPVAM